jgi:hypothetical protein
MPRPLLSEPGSAPEGLMPLREALPGRRPSGPEATRGEGEMFWDYFLSNQESVS